MPEGAERVTRSEVQEVARAHLKASLGDLDPEAARDLSIAAAVLASVSDELPDRDDRDEFVNVHYTVINRWYLDIERLLKAIYDATSYEYRGEPEREGVEGDGRLMRSPGAARFVGDRVYYAIREGVANELREFLEGLPKELHEKTWDREDEIDNLASGDRDIYVSQEMVIQKLKKRVDELEQYVENLTSEPAEESSDAEQPQAVAATEEWGVGGPMGGYEPYTDRRSAENQVLQHGGDLVMRIKIDGQDPQGWIPQELEQEGLEPE